ncbi:MAG: hypothetical protein SGJ21_09125 [Alphaproteobacteria bacterium]|nr:hypothetical protein [Alphaproteobacteria bacterium]
MNKLIVGNDKTIFLDHLPETFLIIDDGAIVDQIPLPARRKITQLDLDFHSFNPLKDIDYRRAREFIAVLDAVFPEGEDTLTKKTSNFALLNALLAQPTRLDKLIPRPSKNDAGAIDAYQKIQTLLLSPGLNRFLCNPTNFSMDGIVLARLDRAQITDFDAFVIANILISNYQADIVVPDFGFYGCSFHVSLIRQNRLIAGVNFLDESPLKNQLLLIGKKLARRSTAKDAATLASYSRLLPGTNAFTDFIQTAIA